MQQFLVQIWHYYRDTSLILKMTAGFVLGLAAALALGKNAEFLTPVGDILLHLLQLIVVPIIMLTLIDAINYAESGNLIRIASKSFVFYILTTMVAMIIGLTLALMAEPGNGLRKPDANVDSPEPPSLADTLTQIVPDNFFKTLADGNILGLIFIAIIVGIGLKSMRNAKDSQIAGYGQQLHQLVLAGRELTFRLLNGVLQYAPIGVFGLVATRIGEQGSGALIALGKLTIVIYAGLTLQILLLYVPLMLVYRVHVLNFFRNCREAMATAFITQSSSGTIPISLQAARRSNLLEDVAGFVIPVGATVNMDGAIIRYGASVVLAANMVGYSMSVTELALLVLTATLVSIGTAGVPGAGLIGLTILLNQAGLPLDIVALVAGVDVILGMGATMLNVTGDLVGTHIIDRSERKSRRLSLPPN